MSEASCCSQRALNLMQTAGIIISVVPMLVEPQRLSFAVSDYDFGLHGRIG
jgi:hypothetical protein